MHGGIKRTHQSSPVIPKAVFLIERYAHQHLLYISFNKSIFIIIIIIIIIITSLKKEFCLSHG